MEELQAKIAKKYYCGSYAGRIFGYATIVGMAAVEWTTQNQCGVKSGRLGQTQPGKSTSKKCSETIAPDLKGVSTSIASHSPLFLFESTAES